MPVNAELSSRILSIVQSIDWPADVPRPAGGRMFYNAEGPAGCSLYRFPGRDLVQTQGTWPDILSIALHHLLQKSNDHRWHGQQALAFIHNEVVRFLTH